MKRQLHLSFLIVLSAGLLSACGTSGGGGNAGGGPTPATGPDITEALTVNGSPAFKLSNGDIVLLDKFEDTQWYLDHFPPPSVQAAKSQKTQSTVSAFDSLPASVILSGSQTPVKEQGGRSTCIDFATAAAIEAGYKRQYGLTLDLSEEWINHIMKMNAFNTYDPVPPSQMENILGVWAGGSVIYNLQLFSSGKLGIPEETALPYLNKSEFEYGNSAAWNPPITDSSSQRTVDNVNLNRDSATFMIPGSFTTTFFPQNAQNTAKYRASQVVYAVGNDLTSPDWFRTQLAFGHEVAFGVRLDKDGPMVDGVWMPGENKFGDHAMLMIGYDDGKQAFRLKNSWGTDWGESGYIWFSYDWVTKGKVYEGAVVQDVMSPNAALPTQQLFYGRYNLDHDGQQGVLDIYHLPDPNIYKPPADTDNRLGTYFGPDNQGRRVNGVIDGRKIDFYIDWGNTGARAFAEMTGLHFTGYLADNNQTLAGTMLDNRDGKTYGFYGLKPDYLTGQATGSIDDFSAYIGNWQVYGLDIPSGSFGITAVNSNTGTITGTQFGGGALTGAVNVSNKRLINFELQGQNYQGYLFGLETGVMAGTVGSGNNTTGFVAFRSDFGQPQVSIISPVNQVYRGVLFQLVGEAKGDNGSGFLVDLPCHWTIDGSPLGSTACSQLTSFSTNGSHTIQLSATAFGNATAQTSITVNVVDPPAVPVINSISINGIILIASPNAAQNFSYDPYLDQGYWGSMPALNMIGLASGQSEPLQYRWTWQGTDSNYNIQAGCPEIQIGTGGAPSWTPAYDVNNCIDYQYGIITLHVTDANNQTVSQAVHIRFVSPPI